MLHKRVCACILILLVSIAGAGVSPASAQAELSKRVGRSGFAPFECPFELPESYTAECGRISVPEDYRNPGGQTIALAVAIVRKDGVTPAPDPVLFLDGGPGGHTLRTAPLFVDRLAPILETRDVIFLDQRGIGFSQPALDCPEVTPQALEDRIQGLSGDSQALQMVEGAIACRDRLSGIGINLRVYNSVHSAADVDALRTALGYDEWNLYGISYGTRLALTVLRDRPQGIRSVILDSPVPPQVNLLADGGANAEAGLQVLFDRCAADLACRPAYPDLPAMYRQVFDSLSVAPVALEVDVPATEEVITLKLNGGLFSSLVVRQLRNHRVIANVPALISNARDGNYKLFEAMLSPMLAGTAAAGASFGQAYAVICTEEAPFVTAGEVAAANAAHPYNVNPGELLYAICEGWGIGSPAPVESQPVTSDVPAFILSGEYDAAAPPAYARLAAATLSNSMVYEFPAVGHGVLMNDDCAVRVTRSFLAAPAAPDASCIADMAQPRFLIGVAATRPLARVLAIGFGVVALGCAAAFAAGLARLQRRKQIAWRAGLGRVGWLPAALSSLAVVVLIFWLPYAPDPVSGEPLLDAASVVEAVIPLAIAIQAALLFSPNDEPALEVLLATPRPFHWVLLERYVIVFALQAAVAAAGVALSSAVTGDVEVFSALARWLPAAIFMSGLSMFITMRSREVAMGIVVTILVCVITLVGRDAFLPIDLGGQPFAVPFDLIQPVTWIIHTYLRPDHATLADYAINRIVLIGAGCLLIGLAVYRLRDTEQMLLGARAVRPNKTEVRE